MNLQVLDALPDGFLDVQPHELASLLPGPTLIRLPGKNKPPLFVATLLHGNEPTGVLALQRILKKYRPGRRHLPRSLLVFIGNPKAAKHQARRLPNQTDFNRIWCGPVLSEHKFAQQLLEILKDTGPFAGIDIHNSSGENPHYSCVNKLDPPYINLGKYFSRTVVYFNHPREVLSRALAEFCPAISIESGQPGETPGVRHVFEFLDTCLNLNSISGSVDPENSLAVYHTIARIQVPPKCRITFNRGIKNTDFCFIENLDSLNFSQLPENTLLGWRVNPDLKLSVQDEKGREVSSHFIQYREGEIRLKRAVVPSLFTTNEKIVHQDCLGYFMQPFLLP